VVLDRRADRRRAGEPAAADDRRRRPRDELHRRSHMIITRTE
jgi:hypothetical protein